MHVRYQVPPAALPLIVERATLVARVRAPGWRFSIAGLADGQQVPLYAIDNPMDPIRLEIADSVR